MMRIRQAKTWVAPATTATVVIVILCTLYAVDPKAAWYGSFALFVGALTLAIWLSRKER